MDAVDVKCNLTSINRMAKSKRKPLESFNLCERVSDAFDEIMVGQFDWYLFPDNIKRLLPSIIIILGQQSIVFDCFGSFRNNRDAFKRVSFINHLLSL